MCGEDVKPEVAGSISAAASSADVIAAADAAVLVEGLADGTSVPSVVADGWRCPRCRYPIAGLPIGGVCPECGLGLRKWRGVLLSERPPAWMREVHAGFGRIIAGVVATSIGAVFFLPGGFIYGMTMDLTGLLLMIPGVCISLGGFAMFVNGWMLATSVDAEAAKVVPSKDRSRLRARVSAWLFAVMSVVVLPGSLFFGSVHVLYGAAACVMLALMAHCFFAMRFVMMLAGRVSGASAYKWAKVFQWFLPVLFFPGWVVVMSIFAACLWIYGYVLYLDFMFTVRRLVDCGMPSKWWKLGLRLKNVGGSSSANPWSPAGGSLQHERDRPGGMA